LTPIHAELPINPVPLPFDPRTLKKSRPYRFTPPDGDLRHGSEHRAAECKRILLVDDDDEIRRLMRAFLEADGYEVFSCRNGIRALQVFTARRDVDLLLSDLQMPVMDGVELSERVTALRPELPVVIVSGAVMNPELLGKIEAHGWDFLAKPCRVPELLGVIARRLAGAPSAAVAA
jgi:CheY-like chemotaxis protein